MVSYKSFSYTRSLLIIVRLLCLSPSIVLGFFVSWITGRLGWRITFYVIGMYLNSFALIYQIHMMRQYAKLDPKGAVDNINANVILAMLAYRTVSALKFWNPSTLSRKIFLVWGFLQIAIMADFIYEYIQALRRGTNMTLVI